MCGPRCIGAVQHGCSLVKSALRSLARRCSPPLQERIIFIDGAMGTMIQRYKLEEEDFRGER